MKKLIILFFTVFVLAGCDFTATDVNTDIPETDYSKFFTDGEDKCTFPKGTKAVDIYNCLVYKGITETESISGTYSFLLTEEESTDNTQNTTKTIASVEVRTETDNPEIHRYYVTFFFENSDGNEDITNIQFLYVWQRQTTNVWNNTSADGQIELNFSGSAS